MSFELFLERATREGLDHLWRPHNVDQDLVQLFLSKDIDKQV